MQKVIKSWLAFCLALGVFASCSEDRNEPSSATEGGERVTLGLYAEVSVDDSEARAIDYKLGKNAKGQIVPMPQFEDNQVVEVHTIIKSNKGAYGVKTLKWLYDAEKKKLVLAPTDREDSSKDLNDIVIENFNNDNDTKWYISGLIGGTRKDGETTISFEGTRVLNGVDGNEGDIVGSLNVPYAFGWTELTITEKPSNTKDNGSYKYAEVSSSAGAKFSPLGSLIAYKLGNDQLAGDYTLLLNGFTVRSNAFGDKGTFELNTAIQSNSSSKGLPTWTEGTPSTLVYRFTSGQEPATIENKSLVAKTYYAWVMPHTLQPSSVNTRVMLKGKSSQPEKDYTNTWFTDYSPVGKTSEGKIADGRVHTLTAKATRRVVLPIEYVTDFDLAGGEGLTAVARRAERLVAGTQGELRFATSHDNDQSGYYNWYKLVGRQDKDFNPNTKHLQSEIDATFGADKYYVPTQDQWWCVFPSNTYYNWLGRGASNRDEYMAFVSGTDLLRRSFRSDWSRGFSEDNDTQDAYIYAIRFKARPVAQAMSIPWEYDTTRGGNKFNTYPSATDDLLKCAYRFRRVNGVAAWNKPHRTDPNLTNRLVVDVVYLGEEDATTELATISNAQWWEDKLADGWGISKTFPASGYLYAVSNGIGVFSDAAFTVDYLSSSLNSASSVCAVSVYNTGLYGSNAHALSGGVPVRLFVRRNY